MVLSYLGGALVAFILFDALWTTVSAQGGGPLSRRFAHALWSVLRIGAPPQSTRRQAAGAVILVSTLWLWVALLWLGWMLVFSGVDGAVVDASSKAPADLAARVYFTGFTVFTLGTGDYVPSGSTWQVLTSLASFTGLFLITLAITYVLPVVQAVVEKRKLAASINALGGSGAEIVRGAEGGRASVARQLERIASDLTLHGERHLVYPIIHHFQSGERRTALAPNVAALSDALLLFRATPGVTDAAAVRTAESSVTGYLNVLSGALLSPAAEAPSPPSCAPLERAGLSVDHNHLHAAAADAEPARRYLVSLLDQNGWAWPVPGADT